MAQRDGPYTLGARATSRSTAEVIFRHVAVAEAWSEWGSFASKARRERAGDEDPNGVGAIRAIPPAREQVVTYEPPLRYGYVVISAMPVKEYRAEINLEPRGETTLIRWEGTFEPRFPGTGPLMQFLLERMLKSFTRRIAYHCEHCEPGCPARLPDAL